MIKRGLYQIFYRSVFIFFTDIFFTDVFFRPPLFYGRSFLLSFILTIVHFSHPRYATVNYPEQVDKCIMVNCPPVMTIVTKLCLMPLPTHVQKRVQVNSDSRAKWLRSEIGSSLSALRSGWKVFEEREARRREVKGAVERVVGREF